MLFLTDFADQAVLSPMMLVIFVGLAVLGWWRGAVAWLVAVGATFAVMAVLKAGGIALAAAFDSGYRVSPSGHVAAAAVVYGGLAVILFRNTLPRLALAAIPLAIVLAVGYTRVALGAHTVGEVVAGATVGLAGLGLLVVTLGEQPRLNPWPLTLAGAATALLLHGMHLPAEQAIYDVSSRW